MRKSSSSQNSPRSSVSPSLAGTRGKRSLKIPARFHDTEYAFRDVAEALRLKGSRESARLSAAAAAAATSSSASSSSTTTPTTTPAPSATPTPATIPQQTTNISTNKAQNSATLKLENEEVGEEMVKALKGAFRPSVTYKKQSVSFSEESAKNVTPTRPLVEHIPNAEPTSQRVRSLNGQSGSNSRHSASKKKSSSRKRPDGLSIIAKQQQQQQIQLQQQLLLPSFADTNSNQNSSSINNITIQLPQHNKPQLQQLLQQPLTQNFQHQTRHLQAQQNGIRLLPMDQPVYLPISVGNISPITATLPMIANAARKPPFISQKFAICLKYQDSLRMSQTLTTYEALVKITRYIGVKDRLALRATCKTWKSIIDSEPVWRKVLVTSNDCDVNWSNLIKSHLSKYGTTDVILYEYETNDSGFTHDLGKLACELLPNLKRIWIKSVNCIQNTIAYRILKSIEPLVSVKSNTAISGGSSNSVQSQRSAFLDHGEIRWQAKVGIDLVGIATVDVYKRVPRTYTKLADKDEDVLTSVELYDLRTEFNWAEKEKSTPGEQTSQVVNIIISPI